MSNEIERICERAKSSGYASSLHLPTLRRHAAECSPGAVLELGVKDGASASAFLLGTRGEVWGIDIRDRPAARALEAAAGGRFRYVIGDSTDPKFGPHECDLLFVDSLHTYEQVQAELRAHAWKVRHYLIFHDVTTFGEVGADGETGRQSWTHQVGKSVPWEYAGIRLAIDEFMIENQEWRIVERHVESHGLLVLGRG